MAQKITCPVCFTKMNSVGHDLVCPSCGYKYCEGRQPYTYDDHNHNQYESYSHKTTYASNAQGSTVYERSANPEGNSVYSRPVNAPGISPIAPSTQSRPVSPRVTTSEGSTSASAAKKLTAKRIIALLVTIYLIFAFIPLIAGGAFLFFTAKSGQEKKGIDSYAESEEEIQIPSFESMEKPETFVQDFLCQEFLKKPEAITTTDCRRIKELELRKDEKGILAHYYVYGPDGIQEKTSVSDYTFINPSEFSLLENLELLSISDELDVTLHPGDLNGLNQLRTLKCSFTPKDIAQAMDPTCLEALYLYPKEASLDLSAINEFENLEILSIMVGDVSHADEIGTLTKLTQLSLYLDSDFSDFQFLESLNKMQYLSLHAPGLDTISFVNEMPQLYWLEAYCAPNLTDVSPLYGCPLLESLDLSCDVNVKDFSPICSLQNLQDLYLFGCEIDDVRWIAEIQSLRCLWLQNNNIHDLSPLAELPNLEDLYCFGNDITYYGDLDRSIIKE